MRALFISCDDEVFIRQIFTAYPRYYFPVERGVLADIALDEEREFVGTKNPAPARRFDKQSVPVFDNDTTLTVVYKEHCDGPKS